MVVPDQRGTVARLPVALVGVWMATAHRWARSGPRDPNLGHAVTIWAEGVTIVARR
jgi:hypothetical protein